MGDMDVMDLGDWEKERIQRLPRHQEVIAVIMSADVVPVGDAGSQDLEFCFEVMRGRSKGRQILTHIPLWDRAGHLTVAARAGVLSLCRAVGIDAMPPDSSAFVGKALRLRLRRVRGSQHHPSADYLPCTEADRKALEGRA